MSWTIDLWIDYCPYGRGTTLSIIWIRLGKWCQRLSSTWNCLGNWDRLLIGFVRTNDLGDLIGMVWTKFMSGAVWQLELSGKTILETPINWHCPGNWFRRLSIKCNLIVWTIDVLVLLKNWDCPDELFWRLPNHWIRLNNRCLVLSKKWNCPNKWLRRLPLNNRNCPDKWLHRLLIVIAWEIDLWWCTWMNLNSRGNCFTRPFNNYWHCPGNQVSEGSVIRKLAASCRATINLVGTPQYHDMMFASTIGSRSSLYTQQLFLLRLFTSSTNSRRTVHSNTINRPWHFSSSNWFIGRGLKRIVGRIIFDWHHHPKSNIWTIPFDRQHPKSTAV